MAMMLISLLYDGFRWSHQNTWRMSNSLSHRLRCPNISTLTFSPPYNWWHDPPGGVFAGFDDAPREWKRRICKNLGWPASTDVANLASMMDQLRSAAQNAIGKEPKFDSAVVTSPDLVALYDEDLFDAAEYLGMDAHQETGFEYKPYLQSDWRYRRQPKHLYAAFVGYGFGVCSHYTSTHLCEQEEKAMPLKPVIAISFTQQGLQLEHHFPDYSEGLITAHTAIPDWQQHPSWYSSDLGFLKYPKDSHRVADKELFWTKVRHQINEWLVDVLGDLNVTDVLLLGESAGTERFKEEVMKAVMESDKQVEAPVIHGGKEVDPLFVASRGAAEMSRRIWEAPVWCGFPQECWVDDAEPVTKTNQ
jgi:hypothetical protein